MNCVECKIILTIAFKNCSECKQVFCIKCMNKNSNSNCKEKECNMYLCTNCKDNHECYYTEEYSRMQSEMSDFFSENNWEIWYDFLSESNYHSYDSYPKMEKIEIWDMFYQNY